MITQDKSTLDTRLELLLPEALKASRRNMVPEIILPIMPSIWAEIPENLPIDIRCAMAERETMRIAPLDMQAGELLAGRLNPYADLSLFKDKPQGIRPFPGGQTAHTALDTEKLLKLGIKGVIQEIENKMESANSSQMVFYKAALISLDGFRILAKRLQSMALEISETAVNPQHKHEMKRLADILSRVPENPAESFYEAIQAMHLLYFAAFITVMGLFGTGRPDVILLPYYKADIHSGRITDDEAFELICSQIILMNYLFALPQPVRVGGLDKSGADTTNELSYMFLNADKKVGLLNPSMAIGVNESTPNDLLEIGVDSLLSGLTKPSLFNDRVITKGLMQYGASYEDAVDYIHSTCVEISMIGKSNIYVASPYINLVKILELMLNDGKPMNPEYDPNDFYNYTRITPPSLDSYSSFDDFLDGYKQQLSAKIEDAANMIANLRKARYEGWAFPFQSCFTDDCIEKGLDIDRGGARYIWTETSCVGLANLTDSLSVIKKRVFEDKTHTLQQLKDMLISNFENCAPCSNIQYDVDMYGNDAPEPDSLAANIVKLIYSEHEKHKDYLGGPFIPGFFCWVMHRILGEQTWASLDGRHAGDVLADAAGSAQGRDKSGPTAAIRSATSWNHEPGIGGIAVNLRFDSHLKNNPSAKSKIVNLIRAFMELGGFEMQLNAVDSKTLRDAQLNPEKYDNLLVRVAGYSDYFTLLDPKMQAEIISRTEHSI